jgi:hypothetical protein
MKKIASLCFLVFIFLSAHSQRVIVELNGKLTDKQGNPLSGWTVENPMISKNNVVGETFQVDNRTITNKGFTHAITYTSEDKGTDKSGASALSSKSYWMGATIGYNLAGKSTEDVVGSAKVVLNPLTNKFLYGEWGIIGNFANFQGNLDKEEIDKSVRKITQTTQGLFLGLGSIWTPSEKLDDENEVLGAFRISFSSGARLNSFTNVGADSTTEDLLQFRNSLGFEFEGGKWKNGGKLTLAIEGSVSFFDKTQYSKVFSESKSSLYVLEGTVVLPIAGNMGLLFNSTITANEKPAFLLGLLFRYDKN